MRSLRGRRLRPPRHQHRASSVARPIRIPRGRRRPPTERQCRRGPMRSGPDAPQRGSSIIPWPRNTRRVAMRRTRTVLQPCDDAALDLFLRRLRIFPKNVLPHQRFRRFVELQSQTQTGGGIVVRHSDDFTASSILNRSDADEFTHLRCRAPRPRRIGGRSEAAIGRLRKRDHALAR